MTDVNNIRRSKLWFLVEWDTPGPSTYGCVNGINLVGPPPRNELSTGKTVLIRRGKRILPGNIVIVSDDKHFVETELKQLRCIAAANLINKFEHCTPAPSAGITVKQETLQSRKRRKPNPTIADELPNSPASTMSLEHIGPNTVSRPTPTPPMTFDQQTQTDISMFKNEFKEDDALEDIKVNQSVIKEDVTGLQNNMLEILHQMGAIKTALEKLQASQNALILKVNEPVPSPKPAISPRSTIIPILTPRPTRMSRMAEATGHIKHNRTFSSTGHNASCPNSPERDYNYDVSSDPYDYVTPPVKPLATSSKMNATFNGYEAKPKPWDLCEGDIATIGTGRTSVPKHVMSQINWTSHTAATRRLLMAVFPRNTLATHSLTGKPSPAFQNNEKPKKKSLDKTKVCDIIQVVTTHCNVTESAVRSAITTKCADENKMHRIRQARKKNQDKENEKEDNEDENVAEDLSMDNSDDHKR